MTRSRHVEPVVTASDQVRAILNGNDSLRQSIDDRDHRGSGLLPVTMGGLLMVVAADLDAELRSLGSEKKGGILRRRDETAEQVRAARVQNVAERLAATRWLASQNVVLDSTYPYSDGRQGRSPRHLTVQGSQEGEATYPVVTFTFTYDHNSERNPDSTANRDVLRDGHFGMEFSDRQAIPSDVTLDALSSVALQIAQNAYVRVPLGYAA
jgi:hypothetical protein